jgi:hypothetical protein
MAQPPSSLFERIKRIILSQGGDFGPVSEEKFARDWQRSLALAKKVKPNASSDEFDDYACWVQWNRFCKLLHSESSLHL